MRIVVPKLQSLILSVTRRDVQLERFIVANVPISPQNPKRIWITLLLRSTAPQTLMSPSNLHFDIKSFKILRFTSTWKQSTRNANRIRIKRCGCGTHNGRCWGSQLERRVAFLSTFLGGFRTWKGQTQGIQLRSGNTQRNNRERETWSMFQKFEMCSKTEYGFWSHFEKYEDRGFRYFYAHENITLLDRCKLVCTHNDLAKLKGFLNKTDVIESSSRERMNTKWRFYKLTNLTVFAAVLKDVPMQSNSTQSYRETIDCLTYEENKRQPTNDNLCLFRALDLHLHGSQRLEGEISKLLNLFINKMDGLSPNQFQGVHTNDIPTVEDLVTLNILLYDIDIVDGNIFGELARRNMQKYNNTVRLLSYNNHIC